MDAGSLSGLSHKLKMRMFRIAEILLWKNLPHRQKIGAKLPTFFSFVRTTHLTHFNEALKLSRN